MNLIENIHLALMGLRASKMRAFLTMLGIIIGIASVIAIVTMGTSLQSSFAQTMADMGMNNIEITLQPSGNSTTYWLDDGDLMTMDMINEMQAYFSDQVAAVSITNPIGSGQIKDGRAYANVSVQGVTDGYRIGGNVEMVGGRFITPADVQGAKNVAVISDFAAKKIFGNSDPLGQEVKVYWNSNIHVFTVVGVYKFTQGGFGGAQATSEEDAYSGIYIPLTTSYYIEGWYPTGYSWFNVVARADADPQQLGDDIARYLGRYYEKNENWDVYAYAMEMYLEQMNSMMGIIATFIGAVAAISLLVGGIGVMNIMLVSVTERTREIGTRKALGARHSAIRMQFLVEAVIICLIGGIIGIILGVLLGASGSTLLIGTMGGGMLAQTVDVPVSVIGIAVGFSMIIGIFFGLYPANKAAKLNPIDALRYE